MPIHCLNCKSNQIKEIVEENNVYYLCEKCSQKSGKALIIDGKIRVLNTSRGIKHIGIVAVVVRNNKILLTLRRTYPFGLELPGGHVEYGETLEEALRREVFEEVGIKVSGQTLLVQIEQPVSYCRYGSDIEEWTLFSVEYSDGEPFVNNSESEAVRWVDVDRIPVKDLAPMTAYALFRLGYVNEYLSAQPK